MTVRLLARLALAVLLASPLAHAEKADRQKQVNFAGDDVNVNYDARTGTLKGNAIITQGTMTVRADRIDFKQNADNSISATVYGNPLSFREKKDDSDEYYEAFAQRAVYDGQKNQLELFDRALLRQGTDEIRSNYIRYNTSTGQFNAEGRPDQPGEPAGPGARVRGTFQPREGEAVPGAKGAPAKGAAPKADAKAAPKADGKAAAPAKPAPPLKLTPDSAQKP